jgi:hypothetical protein
MNCTTLGIDLAKQVFQLHGVDERGHIVLQKRVSRTKLRDGCAAPSPVSSAVSRCYLGAPAMQRRGSLNVAVAKGFRLAFANQFQPA